MYGTNQLQLEQNTRAKRKKRMSHVCTRKNQILRVLSEPVAAVVGSLSIGTSKYKK